MFVVGQDSFSGHFEDIVVHSCFAGLPRNSIQRLLVDYAFPANGSNFSLETERLRTIDCNGSRRYDFNDLKAFQH